MRKPTLCVILTLSLILGTGWTSRAGVISPDLERVLNRLDAEDEVSVIVIVNDQLDVKTFKKKDGNRHRSGLIRALKEKADVSQQSLKVFLRAKKTRRISLLWVINGLAVTAPVKVVRELARQPGIKSIRLDVALAQPEPQPAVAGLPEWNLETIKVPELWGLGFRGAGVVVATMDTGVDPNHRDLGGKWRGGTNSWFDPNGEHSTPFDSTGHGTQVMGLLVGGNATGTAIGVAPDARWIAVKIFDDAGVAELSDIHAGFQWLLDPDNNTETDDAPDVVNNSWGFRTLVSQCYTEFQPDVQALKAAGIAVVFSAGNEGPSPETSVSPANYPESIAVGALDETVTVAPFSSRGPTPCDRSIYPKLTAPGVNIKTADLTLGGVFPTASTSVSGTSFSSAHVAGSMALLRGAAPGVPVNQLETALQESALDLGAIGPDNDYGYGLLDVAGAYAFLQNANPCVDSDHDGYFPDAGCGTHLDCDDDDPGVHPSALEIKHDGIDQDCNGYDLTIDILKAVYTPKRDTLNVEATSSLGRDAQLEVVGYGRMKWAARRSRWTLSVRGAGGNPGSITVSGLEGLETVKVRSSLRSKTREPFILYLNGSKGTLQREK